MSRILDLVLVCLVAAVGWWLFRTPEDPARAAERAPSPATMNAGSTVELPEPAAPLGSPVRPPAHEPWPVDDPGIARHPGLVLLTSRTGAPPFERLPFAVTDDGTALRAEAPDGARHLAIGYLRPELEVLRWIPLESDASGVPTPVEHPLRLTDSLQRVALDVRRPDGERAEGVTFHWLELPAASPFGATPRGMPTNDAGELLLPTHDHTVIVVSWRDRHVRVEQPRDGQHVVFPRD